MLELDRPTRQIKRGNSVMFEYKCHRCRNTYTDRAVTKDKDGKYVPAKGVISCGCDK